MTGDLSSSQEAGANFEISDKTKKDYDFVVGIDFGTTFSGIAYSRVGDVDYNSKIPIIHEISKWPGSHSLNQAPTRSLYKNGKLIKWGTFKLGTDKGCIPISMFKLHLDETKSVKILPLPGITVVQAISDYLRAIFQFACKKLNDTFGKQFDQSKLRFCLTVPAVWTERAKISMREAAIQANIISKNDPQDRLLLVGEPEAAALYCETIMDEYNLVADQNFLICDAGGGTVDLVVYRINVDENGENSLIEEVAGDGGMCGSVNLDIRFRNFVSTKVKELARDVDPLTELELDNITKEFAEKHKFQVYDPSDPDYDEDCFVIELPERFSVIEMDQDNVYIEDRSFFIKPEVMASKIFDPVIESVLYLVDLQLEKVDRQLDAIFLVGGFGQSSYLLQKMKNRFAHDVKTICTPNRGEMAIVRGAVLMGLNPKFVKQRVVRRTYGYECSLEFEEGLDPVELRSKTKDGQIYCNKRFQQYAIKGEIRDIDYYATTSFKCYYNKNPVLQLYGYDGDRENIPRYTTDEAVKEIKKFEIKLPHIPGKGPNDTVVIDIKFYLYQTEIKLWVQIENNIEIYTGSYPDVALAMIREINDEVRQLDIKHGTKDLENSYKADKKVRHEEVPEDDIGIQGSIVEHAKYYRT